MTTLFTTLAQVSFTVSGLMAVAIAGDSKRRDYWFGNESRSFFVYIVFLLLLLPGFVSIGSLIPPYTNNIPIWPFATFVFGLIYLALTIGFFFKKKKLAEPEEFKKLEEKGNTKPNTEMGAYGVSMIVLAIVGFYGYQTSSVIICRWAEIFVGIMLVFSIITGAVNSVILLRVNEPLGKTNNEINTMSSFERSNISSQKENRALYVFITLLIAAISFLIGVYIKHKNDKK